MSEPNQGNGRDDAPDLDDVIQPTEDAFPPSSRRGHGKVPEGLDDGDFAAAEEQERVAAGLEDYAPGQVPPAADPVPPAASEEAERAQRGLRGNDDEEGNHG